MVENYDPRMLFIEKYQTLDVYSKNKLKEFFTKYKIHVRDWNGLTVFYSNSKTFNTIYPLFQTLSIGGDSTFHGHHLNFIIPDNI